jgi:hypothetical protein
MIKYLVGAAVGMVFGLGMTREARAQQPAAEGAPEGAAHHGPPKARVGFQMALRTGYSQPLGGLRDREPNETATNSLAMSDFVSGQVPLIVDIGGKVIPELFVGGYLGLGFGGPAGLQADECSRLNAGCVAVAFRLGIEAQYHIQPGDPVNPWLGYGIGLESLGVGGTVNGQSQSISFGGLEFAHFMGGVDFRLSRVVGLGPFLDFSMGEYTTNSIRQGNAQASMDLTQTKMHEWLTLGIRVVFFP